jgi:hypothetical protein
MSAGMAGPVITSSDTRAKTFLLFAGGLLATLGLVAGVVFLWPSDDGRDPDVVADTTTTEGEGDPDGTTTTAKGATGEPSEQPPTTLGPVDLFTSGAPEVLSELTAAAGDPAQAIEVLVYPDYAFLAYRDPANPGSIDQRIWRDGDVSEAEPNPIDDRVDAATEPKLFDLGELDLDVLASLAADAPSRFELDVAVTHVIVNRFLPFDERVLIRVYASPTDGRSGGGYVQYTLEGTFVKTTQ